MDLFALLLLCIWLYIALLRLLLLVIAGFMVFASGNTCSF